MQRRLFLLGVTACLGCAGDRQHEPPRPTPARLRTLEARAGAPTSETFVFCTPCRKIVVTITLTHSSSAPIDIRFRAEPRPGAQDRPECRCDESGFVQFVHEAAWEFDNAMPRPRKIVGDEVPATTPSSRDEPQEDGTVATTPLDPWYGLDPTRPQDDIHDTPGAGNERIEGGANDGATRKQFVTRYVCRRRRPDGTWEDGTHDFELRWSVYHHADDGWTRVTLTGTQPTRLPTPESPCPGD